MAADTGSLKRFLTDVVRPAIHNPREPVAVAAHSLRGEPIAAQEAIARGFEPFAVGDSWGGAWDTTWFRITGEVPAEWAGEEVALLVHLGGRELVGFSAEGLVHDREGTPLQGLHHRHREFVLTEKAAGGEPVELYVEAAANPMPPWHLPDWPLLLPDYAGEPLYRLAQAELAVVNTEVAALHLDMRILLELAAAVPAREQEIGKALASARAALLSDGARFDRDEAVAAAREILAPALAMRSSSTHAVTAVGHAHIDSAWLWPVRETLRKCARTFSNQLRLMERYPEHRFACSQAVQYQWMKDAYPSIYEQIKRRMAEGRWEPVGGMWVEADTNVPSGESLVRQLVFGKRFFATELGVESRELWIPDVFGYSAALPQIAAAAGVDALVTQKMSWNDTNRFPHSTFWWEGHDGSRVLAHFPPADTYNGDFSAAELARSQETFREHGRSDLSLYPYGYGDGGGGPSAAMLERARRLADAGGLPRVEIGTVAGFLDALRGDGDQLATWVGELYLEAHRATLTTHADVKKANRRGEEALRAAEMWSVGAGIDRQAQLDRAWKLLLFNQFHDILPGSSIHWVYEDTTRDHAEVLRAAAEVTHEALTAIGGGGTGTAVFNAGSHDRTEVVDVHGHLAVVTVPACGWAPVDPDQPAGAVGTVAVGDGFMDNDRLRVEWDHRGLLTRLWDKEAEREVLAPAKVGNLFQLHEDHPRAFDAWDVDRVYLERAEDLTGIESIEVVENDPLRCGVRFVRRFGESELSQTIRLAAGSRRVDFDTAVEWHERHRFLKVAFPVGVRSSRATYEIQHGHIERPTIENTSWDLARFEVCGHRWADLSEARYGVALLNDCKYGYDIRGHTMRLSLLRGPGYPDPEADQGPHRFTYALLPHLGDLRDGRVVEEAEALNLPITVATGDRAAGRLLRLDRPGVSIEAVKWADDRDGVVVRLCEVWGWRQQVRVAHGFGYSAVSRTDLLERDIAPVQDDGAGVSVPLRPFELVTLLFRP